MKKVMVVFLISVFLVSTAGAVTQEQLVQASKTLGRMNRKVRSIKRYVDIAQAGKSGIVTITAEQKQALVDLYMAEKSDLQTLYQELP